MKKLFITILLSFGLLYSQAQYVPNQAYGTINKRGTFDSTLFIPTGCGAPSGIASLKSVFRKQAAKYYDTCAGKEYTFNPKDSTWGLVGSGAITSLQWDSVKSKPALLIAGNNLADVSNVATARTNLNVYSKTEADVRFLQSFTESDPVWSAAAANYYTKTQADARYLQSFTETDPTVYAWAKAATKPAYAVAEITGLQTALDGKQNALGYTPENAANKGQANGYADLDANGKVPASRIDFSQTGQTFVVASQSAMLAVSGANVGAMAIRTDQSRTYVLIATPASTLANWVQLLSPDAPVQSVNGQTGNVNLLTTNIGEGTNLYYTDARARAALSAGTGISYNNTTGQISSTITQYTDALARASLSFAAGSGGYNSSTGVITIPTNTNQLTNGAGFITSINSTMVATALGYTPPQPNGTGATAGSTWAINITGNAASASNSTGWNGEQLDYSSIYNTAPQYIIGYASARTRPFSASAVQSFLGLDSYAYRSSGLAELSGATFTGAINVYNGASAAQIFMGSAGTQWSIGRDNITTGNFRIREDGTTYVTINTGTGAATFSGLGTFNSNLLVTASAHPNITINAPTDNFAQLIYNENGSLKWNAYNDFATDNYVLGNSGGARFTLTQGGVPTFSFNSGGFPAFVTNDATAANNAGGGFYNVASATASNRLAALWLDADGGNFAGSDYAVVEKLGNGGKVRIMNYNTSGIAFGTATTEHVNINGSTGAITAPAFIRSGGTSSQFLKADGSVDGNNYLTTAVTSATGTANQITVSASTGAVTFSLPSAVTISGNMTAAGFFESSDIRLKDVFQTYSSADHIPTIQYTFKGEFKVKYGYSAQEVQKIIPSAVEVGSDGFYKVDYTSVHSYKIMMLEKRIADLERRVNNALPEQGIKISY